MNNSYLRFLNNVLSIKKSEICIPFKTKSNVSKFGLITSKTTGDIKDILNWYKKEGIDKIITNIKSYKASWIKDTKKNRLLLSNYYSKKSEKKSLTLLSNKILKFFN